MAQYYIKHVNIADMDKCPANLSWGHPPIKIEYTSVTETCKFWTKFVPNVFRQMTGNLYKEILLTRMPMTLFLEDNRQLKLTSIVTETTTYMIESYIMITQHK